jgi:DNA-binding response OmpR family regulator
MSLRIVVVEDNQLVLEELVVRLNLEGYQASGVDCGESLDQVFQRERVDLLIVDLNLPQEDGLGVIERVRRASPRIRIIILTARSTPSDKEQGYLAGADLYLGKPVRIRELLAAITSLHRRLQEVENVSQRDWLLFTDEWLLETPSGISLQLTPGETSLLQCLALSPKQTASMNCLLDHLAVASDPDGRNLLMVKVSRLRKKLEAVAKDEETIRSIRQEGYRLCLPVQLHYRS